MAANRMLSLVFLGFGMLIRKQFLSRKCVLMKLQSSVYDMYV